jgi:hypothetical protein
VFESNHVSNVVSDTVQIGATLPGNFISAATGCVKKHIKIVNTVFAEGFMFINISLEYDFYLKSRLT